MHAIEMGQVMAAVSSATCPSLCVLRIATRVTSGCIRVISRHCVVAEGNGDFCPPIEDPKVNKTISNQECVKKAKGFYVASFM